MVGTTHEEKNKNAISRITYYWFSVHNICDGGRL